VNLVVSVQISTYLAAVLLIWFGCWLKFICLFTVHTSSQGSSPFSLDTSYYLITEESLYGLESDCSTVPLAVQTCSPDVHFDVVGLVIVQLSDLLFVFSSLYSNYIFPTCRTLLSSILSIIYRLYQSINLKTHRITCSYSSHWTWLPFLQSLLHRMSIHQRSINF
jgi:hypothetical protein